MSRNGLWNSAPRTSTSCPAYSQYCVMTRPLSSRNIEGRLSLTYTLLRLVKQRSPRKNEIGLIPRSEKVLVSTRTWRYSLCMTVKEQFQSSAFDLKYQLKPQELPTRVLNEQPASISIASVYLTFVCFILILSDKMTYNSFKEVLH